MRVRRVRLWPQLFALWLTAIAASGALCFGVYRLLGLPVLGPGRAGWVMFLAPLITPALVEPAIGVPIMRSKERVARLLAILEAARRDAEREAALHLAARLRFEELARRDPLTGLLNRRGFFECWETLPPGHYRVFTIDVDNFKEVNDARGHATGDMVLQAVAQALESAANSEGHTGRLGGDEFAVVVPAAVIEIDQRLRDALSDLTVNANDEPFSVTSSVGMSELDRTEPIDLALGTADLSMYHAKRYRQRSRSAAATAPRSDALLADPAQRADGRSHHGLSIAEPAVANPIIVDSPIIVDLPGP